MDLIWQTIQAEFADIGDEREIVRILVRLVMAAVLGAVLGFEREHKGKSAGVRTHMLVSLGAALFVLAPSMAGADAQALSRVIQASLPVSAFWARAPFSKAMARTPVM